MTGPERIRRSHQPKPRRLRAACNQCNTAKVKCTGERSGCSRCVSLRVDCIYVESRVGKVQGVREKRKKPQGDSAATDDTNHSRSNSFQVQEEHTSEEHETIRVSAPKLPSPKRQVPGSYDQVLQGWSAEQWSWDDALLSLDAPVTMFNDLSDNIGTIRGTTSRTAESELSSTTSVSACESSLPGLDLGHTGSVTTAAPASPAFSSVGLPPPSSQILAPLFSTSSLSTSTTTASIRPAEPRPAGSSASNPKLDSKCALALANMVVTLEQYLLSELKALDLIINTVRHVTAEIRKIVQYQQENRCDRCQFLFITILYQIIALLEAGSNTIFETEALENEGSGSMSMDLTPKFGLGAFSINAEEQRSLRANIIRKECQNTREMMAQIITLAKLGPRGSPPATPAQLEERVKCFSGLQRRLKALSDKACSTM